MPAQYRLPCSPQLSPPRWHVCCAGASSFRGWFGGLQDSQSTRWTAGTLGWDSAQGMRVFTEAPAERSTNFQAAALEVRPVSLASALTLCWHAGILYSVGCILL